MKVEDAVETGNRGTPVVIWQWGRVLGSRLAFNQWGWDWNSEFATLVILVPSGFRVEMNDTVTELVKWHFSGS